MYCLFNEGVDLFILIKVGILEGLGWFLEDMDIVVKVFCFEGNELFFRYFWVVCLIILYEKYCIGFGFFNCGVFCILLFGFGFFLGNMSIEVSFDVIFVIIVDLILVVGLDLDDVLLLLLVFIVFGVILVFVNESIIFRWGINFRN